MADARGKTKKDREGTGAEAPSDFSPEELRAISAEVTGAFPPPQDTGLVLLDVDPRRLHAYWTVTPAEMADARRGLCNGEERAPMVLRVHDLADEDAAPFDLEVLGLQSRQYVDLFKDGGSYRAELGLLNDDGSLVTVATSNRVDLPDLPPAGDLAPEFPLSTDGAVAPEPVSENAETFPEVSEDDLQAFADLAHRSEADFAEEAPEVPPASALSAPALEPPPQEKGGATMPLENVLTYSSFGLGREEVDLEVHAELHVYGRATPGKKLTLFGRPVALRPDGTFSVRRPLPDGAVVLPLTVTTEDGEE